MAGGFFVESGVVFMGAECPEHGFMVRTDGVRRCRVKKCDRVLQWSETEKDNDISSRDLARMNSPKVFKLPDGWEPDFVIERRNKMGSS